MVDVEDDHLGGAAGLAAGLDDAGEGVEAAHEAKRAGGGAAAGERLRRAADGREVRAGARSPLEEHALGLGEGEDGVERVVDGVDEAGGALRVAVAGGGEDRPRAVCGIPVPVLRVGVGLEAVAADVEPDGRVEGDLLLEEQVGELVVEGRRRPRRRRSSRPAMPQSRMVSATRVTRARTPVSRSGVPIWPWRYLEATMLVAVMDQSAGTSTSFCSKMILPLMSLMAAVRSSHWSSS